MPTSSPLRGPAAVLAASLVAFAGVGAFVPGPAVANESHAISDKYLDGLDSRHSADAIAGMALGAGYTATAANDGRTADEAWAEALNSSIFAFFGHANAGVLQVKDRASINDDEFLGAGTTTELLPLYENFRFFSEFAPFVDVDDMRLAILAGCYTANTDEALGDFEDVTRSRGVDATVAFPGLVYYPGECVSCVYSGNYFWDRFAQHYRGGATLSQSLSRARTDLVAKEGGAGGWDKYRITGSVASPGLVKLRPTGGGEPATSQPLGTSAYTLDSLTVTSTRPLMDGEHEERTQEGVVVRRDSTGRVVDVWAPSSRTAGATLPTEELLATSRTFVDDVAGGEGWTLTAQEDLFHLDGEKLVTFTWEREGASPEIVDVEVDRRTGAVTYLGWARAPQATSGAIALTADEAEQVALQHSAPGVQVVGIEQLSWGGHHWVVRTRNDADRAALGPQYQELTIDADTGDLLQRTTT